MAGLALLEKHHRSLMHISFGMILEGTRTKVLGADDVGWVVVPSTTQLILKINAHRTFQ